MPINSFVKLGYFTNLNTAEIALSNLKSNGISAFIENPISLSIMPLQGISPFGVCVMVDAKDAHLALKILETYKSDNDQEPTVL